MNAADTNVLVRIITGDEPAQTKAADRFVEQCAWVSILALAETVWVLKNAYSKNAASIAEAVDMLLGHTKLVVQDADAVAAALELFRSRPTLGFSDCLMVQLARKAGHLPLGRSTAGWGGLRALC